MSCRFCGTELPVGAQFCGECGRTVSATAPPPKRRRPEMPAIRLSAEPDPESAPRAIAVADSEYTCPQCAAPIEEDDVFCGTCGFVLTSSYLSSPADSVGDPRGTTVVEDDSLDAEVTPQPLPEPLPEPEPELAGAARQKILRKVPDPFPWGQPSRLPTVDLEATRISAAPLAEERFVLQFSTGESVTVSGAGLIGRNPASQPGEFVDQLVTIFDAGKSVSKTHLEFGQDGGRFWVSDRYSTNGSTVRQPDSEPKRCEPGRRYFVARGTRVDIGEQFFVVS